MSVRFVHRAGAALLGVASALGIAGVVTGAPEAARAAQPWQLVRCSGVMEPARGVVHSLSAASSTWMLARSAQTPPAYCSGDGNEPAPAGDPPATPPWLERQPGMVGLPRLLVHAPQAVEPDAGVRHAPPPVNT